MAGSSASDGGRILKAGWLAFGALISAAPVYAQAHDPLAPLPTPQPSSSQSIPSQPALPDSDSAPTQTFTIPQLPAQQPATPPAATQPQAQPAPPPVQVVAVPKD